MMGNSISQITLNLFKNFLKQELNSLLKIADFEGDVFVENKTLYFTLRGLFELLNVDGSMSYEVFRRALYNSQLNEELKAYNGHVDVHHSTGKVNDSVYKLVRMLPVQRENSD